MQTVYELKKKKKKKYGLIKAAASVLMLAVISVFAAILITNNGKLNVDGFKRLFDSAGNKTEAAEFSFDIGVGSVYADMDNGLAVCSGGGIQVYDADAKKVFSEAFEMKCPTISSNGKVSAAYDLGGKTLKVFDLYGVTKSLTTEGKIISASLNENGWLTVCSQKTGGYKGRVTVYNETVRERYYWDSAEGHILSAALSPDNKSLAVLTLTNEGSRVVFFALDSADEKGACTLAGELVLEIKYLSDGKVLTVTKEAVRLVRPDGSADVINDYAGKYLTGYSIGGESFAALVLNEYLVGDQASIVTVDHRGKQLGALQTNRKIISFSSKGDYMAVLFSDGLVIYDRELKECARFDDTVGAEQAIMRADGKALILTPHSASVCSITED